MSFQVGIGSLGGTVFFQVGLCTPLRTMNCILVLPYIVDFTNYSSQIVRFVDSNTLYASRLREIVVPEGLILWSFRILLKYL